MSEPRRLGDIMGPPPVVYTGILKKCPLCLYEWRGNAFSPDFENGNAHISRCDDCIARLDREWKARNAPIVKVTDLLPPKRVRE